MAINNVLEYSTTAASNVDVAGISILGTANPSNFDNALRAFMAQIAEAQPRQVVKTSGYTALKSDHMQLIEFDDTYTLGLTAAATLSSGWMCYVRANGGDVTIDPDASETINGAASLSVPDGSFAIVFCNGTGFIASVTTQVTFGTTAGTAAEGDDSRITGAVQSSLLTTRGDIIYRNATVPARLAKGAAGAILTSGTDDPEWQMRNRSVSIRPSTLHTTTSSSMQNAASFNIAITPSSTSKRVKITAQFTVGGEVDSAGNGGITVEVRRGTTVLDTVRMGVDDRGPGGEWWGTIPFIYIDNPASASSVSYNVRFLSAYGGPDVTMNDGANSSITLEEVDVV